MHVGALPDKHFARRGEQFAEQDATLFLRF